MTLDQGGDRRPVRTFVALFALLAALLFGGMAVGLAIALTVAGGTVGAVVVGFLWLPLCLGLGLAAWRAIVVAWLARGVLSALVRSRGDEAAFRNVTREQLRSVPGGGLPGTWVFVPVAAVVSGVAAVAMSILAAANGAVAGVLTLAVGLGYGMLLRRLTKRGWLLPPD